eukprot:3815098-Pyramimonas_sp.AAC.2
MAPPATAARSVPLWFAPTQFLIDFAHAAEFEILVGMFMLIMYLVIQDLTSQPNMGAVFESRPLN